MMLVCNIDAAENLPDEPQEAMELSPPAALSHRFGLMIESCPEHNYLLSVCVWQS